MRRTNPHRLRCLLAYALAILAVLLFGCGEKPGDDASPSADEPAAGPGFDALPEVDLSALSSNARQRIEEARSNLEAALPDAEDDDGRAAAWGDFAETAHAYGLLQLAVPGYERAVDLASAQSADSGRWRYLLAVIDQEAGRLDDAAERLLALQDERPDDAAVQVRLAEIRLAQGADDDAADRFRVLLTIDGTAASAHFGLGRLASTAGRHEEAIEHWAQALEIQPEAKNLHSLLASAYRRVGDEEKARFHAAQIGTGFVHFDDPVLTAVEELSTGIGRWIEDALRKVEDDDWQAALASYEKALEIDPANLAALGGKAFMLRMLRNPQAAEAAYRTLLEIHPDENLSRLELGTLLSEAPDDDTDRLEEAVVQLEAVVAADPDFEQAHTNLGVAYTRLGRWQEAADAFRSALEIDADDPKARFRHAVALDQLKRPDEAVAELRRLVGDVPTHVPARQRLGELLERTGDLAGAVAAYRHVLQVAGVPDQEAALAHYQLGRLCSRADGPCFDPETAFGHFTRAVELFPDLWQARFAVARRLGDQGRWQDAADQYAVVVDQQPTRVEPRALEAEARMLAGQWQPAANLLQRGLEINPQAAPLGHLLARWLAVAPEGLRDPQRALSLARSLFEAQPSMAHSETVIMAMAAAGQLDEALALQEQLVARAEDAPDQVPDRDLSRLRGNLDRYRRGLPPTLNP